MLDRVFMLQGTTAMPSTRNVPLDMAAAMFESS